jgi:hypothetical protein
VKQRSRILTAAAFAILACVGGQEAARADSIFALNLLGERVDVGDARVAALGGFVQTVDDSLGVLQYNPAALAWMKRFSFGAAGYFTSDVNKSEDLDQRNNGTTFTHLLFAFPVYHQRITAGVGFRGRYDPDGEFIVPGVTAAGDPYNDHYERRGGLFAVPIQVAFDAGNYAKIGVFYSLERGKIEETWLTEFEGTNADASSDRERVFRGHCLGAGFVSRPTPSLSIGLTYESQINYDVDVTETFTSSSADTNSTETAKMPARMTVSASYRLSRDMTLFAGGSLCDFRNFEGIGFPDDRLAQEEIGSLGVEYRLGDSRVPVRGSFTYEQLPYMMPTGENIKRIGFAVGTGRIMRGGRGKMDVALQFANTGSVNTNNYSDRSVRFYLSITGSEDWKRKRDRRE